MNIEKLLNNLFKKEVILRHLEQFFLFSSIAGAAAVVFEQTGGVGASIGAAVCFVLGVVLGSIREE